MRVLLFSCIAALLLLSSFNSSKKNKPRLPEEFVYIPMGTMYIHASGEDSVLVEKALRPVIDSSKIRSTGHFYMSKFEVTNLQYRQFYNEVSPGMTEQEKEKIICDS